MSVVGRYELLDRIGEGGMSVVYLARQRDLDRQVALKELRLGSHEDPSIAERFLREARLAGSLSHPNIVTVHEHFKHEGTPYIAMEYLPRGSLRPWVGSMTLAQVAGVLEGVLAALDHAERYGIVHRDLKPENLLVTDQGQVKVADFGIAKARNLSRADAFLTAEGATLGTPLYMAPEQAMGSELGPSSDLYSVGVMAYELLTGRPPFEAEGSPLAVLMRHVNEAIPPARTIDSNIDAELSDWIDRLLIKEPAQRTASAQQAWDELEEIVLRLLGSRWRRDARLPAQPGATPPVADGGAAPAEVEPLAPPPPPRPPATEPSGSAIEPGQDEAAPDAEPALAPVQIHLTPMFRFVQEPLRPGDPIPLLGNAEIVDALADRLLHGGGLTIVTGFRGVGKTTIVERALDKVRREAGEVRLVLRIAVARPLPTVDLLFDILRRLYDELQERDLLARLAPELRARLETAHRRTSQMLTTTTASEHERTGGLDAKLLAGGRRSMRSDARQEAYLAYSEGDAERDLTYIVERLRSGSAARRPAGWKDRVRVWRDDEPWRAQVIVVLDELDKLRESKGGKRWLRELVTGTKTILTERGMSFVFVGGEDLHAKIADSRARADGLFEIGWHQYVPCIWNAEGRLLDALIPDPDDRVARHIDALRRHLAFCGRGVPRLVLRELNSLVARDGEGFFLDLDHDALARIELFARLHRVVWELCEEFEPNALRDAHEADHARSCVFWVAQLIVARPDSFTVDEIVEAGERAGIRPARGLAPTVHDLVAALQRHGLLRQVGGALADATFVGDVAAAQVPAYRLADRVPDVGSAAGRGAAAATGFMPAVSQRSRPRPVIGQKLRGGRYVTIRELARTSTGRVYAGFDATAGEDVAIKLYDLANLADSKRMRARFLRESRIARTLQHPHLLRARDAFEEPDRRLVLVSDLLDGVSVKERVAADGPFAPRDAIAITLHVLEALEYLHERRIARLDLTPGGILVDARLVPTITKLGLIKREGDASITQAGAVIGTAAYAAPEQLMGLEVDIRADLYSLARIVVHMLTGHGSRQGPVGGLLRSAGLAAVDLGELDVSPQLHDAIATALASDPAGRFSDPRAMMVALGAVPEAQ